MSTTMIHPLSGHVKADYGKARKAALGLLQNAGYIEPPIDPVRIAETLGVKVYFVEFKGPSDETISGFYDCEEDVIMVNKNEFAPRQTFTVAHELGHKVLHEEWARSDNYKVLLRDPSLRESNSIEQEANFFAANLLMPKKLMDEYYQLPIDQISSLFAVSIPAVRARLQSLYGI
jgi:Zn-dependent peptidase ImmA (M78 family)